MVIIAILVLGFLIFVHELGHFMVAKMVGIQVLEFSIGFGPKFLGFQKSEDTTMYSLRILPLGGFVRMAGMDPEEEDDHVNGYNSKPLKSRFAVISAGSVMNFLVAILLFVITFGLIGQPAASNSNLIGEVLAESPAMTAGLRAGDRIVSINGVPTRNWEEVAGSIRESGERDLNLVVERQEQKLSYTVTPRYDPQYEIYQIGITQQVIWQKQGFISAIKLGLIKAFEFARLVLVGLVGLIGGTISTNEVAGPVGITVAIGEAAAGGAGYLMIFTAILGINLALINILPIPALDGSKLIFLMIEGLRGKPVAPEKENFIHLIGFALLMVLFVLITYNDIARIFTGGLASMIYKRKKTRQVRVGNALVGGDAPITVQTMTKTDTRDAAATISQIKELESIGCEIIRVAVPDQEAAESLKIIKKEISIPIVADIHFDYRLALVAIKSGVDGLRINPGNIGGPKRVHELVRAAAGKDIPIRIGVNMGSLDPEIAERYGRTAKGLVESALTHVSLLESESYYNIVISVKATSVPVTIEAYRLLSEKVDYPLHLGVTEAGGARVGTIKSAIGIGSLLADRIGDTIRVSLTDHPSEEIRVGLQILKSLGLRTGGIELISCPTCGRCQIDLFKVLNEVEKHLPVTDEDLKVAIMGCVVNGPGEAKDADVGIAGGKGCAILFKHGKLVKKVPEDELMETLISEIEQILEERKQVR